MMSSGARQFRIPFIQEDVISFEKKFKRMLFGIAGVALALAVCQKAAAQTATVTWTNTHQTMDGFGAEDWNSAENLTNEQAAMFFSPTSGIGLSIMKTENYGCPNTGACAVQTSNIPDLGSLQKAVANGAQIDIGIVPPANLQYNGNTFVNGPAGANGSCLPTSNYSAFANYTVEWIQMLNVNNAPVTFLQVANEPDAPSPVKNSLGSCVWNASSLHTYIGTYLGPALANSGLTSVKVLFPKEGFWFGGPSGDIYSECLNDSNCNQYISVVAMDGYGGSAAPDGFGTGYCCSTATPPPSVTNGKHIWMSEVNGGFTYMSGASLWKWDPSVSDAMVWARNIHDFLTLGNVSGWLYWELADCCVSESGVPYNDGLTLADLSTTSVRMYVIGNWSKFVRPGWQRIDATTNPQAGVYVTAFKNPSDTSFVVVAVNTNQSGTAQTFDLSGFPAVTSVVPWTTDSSLSLAAQSSIDINGDAFTYALPGESVTSFVAQVGSSNAGNTVAPPTKLTVTVQ